MKLDSDYIIKIEEDRQNKIQKKNRRRVLIVTFLVSSFMMQKYLFAVNPADTSILASIEAKATVIVTYAKNMIDLYNKQIEAVNNVFRAAEKTKQFTEMMISPEKNIFYKQAKQLSGYIKTFTHNNDDPFKIRLKKFNLEAQTLVQKYEELSYQYDVTERAWKRAAKPFLDKDKMKEINRNPSNSAYIYAANQNVKDMYYRTKGMAYDQEIQEIENQILFDRMTDKFPIDKSPEEVFYESTKHMSIKIQLDQLKMMKEIHSTLVAMLQVQSGNSVPNTSFPKLSDFKKAYERASTGLPLDDDKKPNDSSVSLNNGR